MVTLQEKRDESRIRESAAAYFTAVHMIDTTSGERQENFRRMRTKANERLVEAIYDATDAGIPHEVILNSVTAGYDRRDALAARSRKKG